MRTDGRSRRDAPRLHLPILFVVGVMLAGCGFQLRGAAIADPALSPMRIESVRTGSPLLPPLRRALAHAGVTVAPAGAPSATALRVVAEESVERVIALSPQGRPREIELTYHVEFEVTDAAGILVERRELRMSREYAVIETDVLGKSHEAEVLRAALLHDMVSALVRHVTAAKPK